MRQLPLLLLVSLAACAAPPAADRPAANHPAAHGPVAGTSQPPQRVPDAQMLASRHWRLVEATDASGQRVAALFPDPSTPLQFDFGDGRLAVANTCNQMQAPFALKGARLGIGPVLRTKKYCGGGPLMAAEEAVAERLAAPLTVSMEGERLVLSPAGGGRLVLVGEATAEARYGGPGEVLFMEVDAAAVPCPGAAATQPPCLRVREVAYDDDGVRGEAGAWEVLEQPIEGYRHAPGQRQVLRLRRHRAAGGAPAYVLDTVVESEQVGP